MWRAVIFALVCTYVDGSSVLAAVPRGLSPLGDPGQWITPDDYPPAAFQAGAGGNVGFQLTVDEHGSVSACRVTVSSTNPLLDQSTCPLLIQRAHFSPAVDASNKPLVSTYTSIVRWSVSSADEDRNSTDPCQGHASQLPTDQCVIPSGLPSLDALPAISIAMQDGMLTCRTKIYGQERLIEDQTCGDIAGYKMSTGAKLPFSTRMMWPGGLPLKPRN